MKGFWLTVWAQLIGEQFAVHRATFNQFSFIASATPMLENGQLMKSFSKGACVEVKTGKCFGLCFGFVHLDSPIRNS